MVRITLPNRLKSYGGANISTSATHSRSSSPNPGVKRSNTMDSMEVGQKKVEGLVLKVVVIRVSSASPYCCWGNCGV